MTFNICQKICAIFDINSDFQLRGKKIARYDQDTGDIYLKINKNPDQVQHLTTLSMEAQFHHTISLTRN
jgi:hypothetical protein